MSAVDKVRVILNNYEKSIETFKKEFNETIIDIIKSVWLPSDRSDIIDIDNLAFEYSYNVEYDATTIIISENLIWTCGVTRYSSSSLWKHIPVPLVDMVGEEMYNNMYVKSSITDLTEDEMNKLNIIRSLLYLCITSIDETYRNALI
jgi:hypothetical protein